MSEDLIACETRWNQYRTLRPLYSLTIGSYFVFAKFNMPTGILGIGDIGEEIARTLTLGFRANVPALFNHNLHHQVLG